jgi:hypothetical protein
LFEIYVAASVFIKFGTVHITECLLNNVNQRTPPKAHTIRFITQNVQPVYFDSINIPPKRHILNYKFGYPTKIIKHFTR